MYEFAWFLGGALTYKLLFFFVNTARAVNVLKTIQLQSLLLLVTAVEATAFIRYIKKRALKDSDASEEEILVYQKVDEEFFENWKASTIIKLNEALPEKFRTMSLRDWTAAIDILDKAYSKGNKS
tara:strand:+ start:187 stop:561 length:375 start_codon:yes stop_codon:yes gene_type:complete